MSAIDDYMRLRKAMLEFFLIICKELRIDEAVKQIDALLTGDEDCKS